MPFLTSEQANDLLVRLQGRGHEISEIVIGRDQRLRRRLDNLADLTLNEELYVLDVLDVLDQEEHASGRRLSKDEIVAMFPNALLGGTQAMLEPAQ